MFLRRVRGLWGTFTRVLGAVFLVSLFGTALGSLGMYAAIHHTAQPEFCNTCHIMEPYYESWRTSSHNDVGCIECHYEPGAVETLHGKFEALSQLAKYVTRTQGTKPWAEVSDASCMRSGCHSVRMLEGQVSFGEVKFDHRQHLLESRRGRRLRCVTCHSQIVQGDHLSVTASVCFMCHFMPDEDGRVPEATSDCLLCHGPPKEPVVVEGKEFDHTDYVARGVDCRECHDPVIEGDGTVRRERCHSCHGEAGHIEHIGDIAYMHETHVTNHKVECFECHDDIHHGLLELPEPRPAASEGCGSCHDSSHDAALKVYAGQGAVGVEERPSRMYQTRVLCRACHTGRAGRLATGERARQLERDDPHGGMLAAHTELGVGTVARAGNIDCIHCHGTGFDGMLGRWQGSVEGALSTVQPALAQLERELEDADEPAARELYDEAHRNVQLVRLDGSRGAHNPAYALEALRASAERIDRARALLGDEPAEPVASVFRPATSLGCDECHADIGMGAAPAGAVDAFPHRLHLTEAALDCDTCHGVGDEHGRTMPREDCASCHHREDADADLADCARCHSTQAGFLHGTLAELPSLEPSVMAEMDCSECHGEAPDIMKPPPQMCVLCHEEGYDALDLEWQAAVGEQLERLSPVLGELRAALGSKPDGEAWEAYHEAVTGIELVSRDGSLGVHNVAGAMNGLRASAVQMDRVRELLGLEDVPRANTDFPFRSDHGCQKCHAGIGRPASVTRAEAVFPHRRHLYDAHLDCDACHSVEEHGEPSLSRENCADCHHRASEERELPACTTCHESQARMLQGDLSGFEPLEGTMAELECDQCHGAPPDLVAQPNPRLCVICHERGYDDMLGQWQTEVGELMARLLTALDEASAAGAAPEALERGRRALKAVEADRSRGVHNFELSKRLLEDALDDLQGD
jgi:hypothetical protein